MWVYLTRLSELLPSLSHIRDHVLSYLNEIYSCRSFSTLPLVSLKGASYLRRCLLVIQFIWMASWGFSSHVSIQIVAQTQLSCKGTVNCPHFSGLDPCHLWSSSRETSPFWLRVPLWPDLLCMKFVTYLHVCMFAHKYMNMPAQTPCNTKYSLFTFAASFFFNVTTNSSLSSIWCSRLLIIGQWLHLWMNPFIIGCVANWFTVLFYI